ncbi:MAG: 1-deoxy-D-xylulose-5-phosphate synthase, partial [Firmicutes bacterium]|nr:1-deoxy-D-xylulose-5-phosphate synthase [Bacillota bacterium]
RIKHDAESLLETAPSFIGLPMKKTLERLKELVHKTVLTGNVFEEFGFKYFGPVDGHNVAELINVLRNVRQLSGPVLVHVITQKGKGYTPAEQRPEVFHGPGPFEVATGEIIHTNAPPSYSQVFSETLIDLARDNEKIVAITAAMPDGTKLELFEKAYPRRFFDVGIAEQHAATFAAGLAIAGMRPVFAVYSTFLQRAYDQVIHDICHQDLPVLLGVDRAGLVGSDGATHQGVFDIAFLRTIPNMEIAMGKDEQDMRGLLKAALERPHPVALRYPRGAVRGIDHSEGIPLIEWGKGEWLHTGKDLVFVALGPLVYQALEARNMLLKQGWDVGVVNARFVKPLDGQLLNDVAQNTRLIMTVEEHAEAGGFGSAVS